MKYSRQFIAFILTIILLSFSSLHAQVNLNKGLIFWLPINGNANDASGNGKNGTVNSGTLTYDRFGVANSAYNFTGAVGITVNSINNGGNSANTMSMWIKTTGTTQGVRLYAGAGGSAYLNLYTTGHYLPYFDNTGNGKSSAYESLSAVNTGKWVLLTAKYSGGTTYIYVNGKLETTCSSTYYTGSVTSEVFPDYNSYYSAGYYGDIDDVRAYNRALSDSEVIAIYELPHAAFGVGNKCVGDTVHFTDSSIVTTGANYLWKFGDNTTSSSQYPVHSYSKSGTYKVTLIVTSPYKSVDSTTRLVVIYPLPAVNYTANVNSYKNLVSFIPGDTTLSSYYWDFGDNNFSNQKKPVHVYKTYGKYNVTLAVTNGNGCAASHIASITIYQPPIAAIGAINTCLLKNTQFIDSSSEPDSCTYFWDFGDKSASSLKNPIHMYTSAGTFKVRFKITSPRGLIDSVSKTVVVYPLPAISFTYKITGYTVSFASSDKNLSAYSWDFGDSTQSQAKDPVHAFSSYGTYIVSLTVRNTNGCDSTYKVNLTLFQIPVASVSASDFCLGDSMHFDFSGSAPAGSVYSWRFGDNTGSSLKNPAHYYLSAGTYIVSLKVTNSQGSSDSAFKSVVVMPLPVSSFVYTTNATTLTFSPVDSSNFSYIWDFGDKNSSTARNPVHTYTNSGIFKVTLSVENKNGCSASTEKTITVNDVPVASFAASNSCEGDTIVFTDMSAAPPASNYSWNFGDGSNSSLKNPKHVFSSSGKYKVILKVTNPDGVSDTISKTISISPKPSARFKVHINDFRVSYIPLDTSVADYLWDFGDSNSSLFKNPVYTYSHKGVFNVSLKVRNSFGCDSTLTIPLTINGSTGIDENKGLEIQDMVIYPNPVEQGKLHVMFYLISTNCLLQIINIEGKVVYSEILPEVKTSQDKAIDVSRFAAGIYSVRFISSQHTVNDKIVIK